MLRLKHLFLSLISVASAFAAEIDWQTPESVTGNLSDFVTSGTLVTAYSGDNSTVTVDPTGLDIDFIGNTGHLSSGVFNADPATLADPTYDALLQNATWSGSDSSLAISGLNSGTDYLIQLWVADTRSCCSHRQKTYDSGGGTESVTLDTGPPSSFVIGTFTADSSTQDVHFRGSGATHPQYNAIQVRTAGASIPVFTLTQGNVTNETILANPNSTVTLTWEVSGTSTVSIDQGIGNVAASGSLLVPIGSTTKTFTITAGNPGSETTAIATAVVDSSPQPPALTEVLSNPTSSNLIDEDGDTSDWIELFNPNLYPLDLSGYHLSDDPGNNTLWTFPASSIIAANSHLIVFASSKNRTDPNQNLHTNFQLSSTADQISLFAPDGTTNLGNFSWTAANEHPDGVSFGTYGTPVANQLFTTPSPGEANTPPFYLAGKVLFSEPGRTFTGSLGITLTPEVPGMEIRYTTDRSEPDENSTLYTTPLTLSSSTMLRARLVHPSDANSQGDISARHYLRLSTSTISASLQSGASTLPNFTSDLPIIVIDNFGGSTANRTDLRTTSVTVFEPVNGTASFSQTPDLSSRAAYRIRGASSAGFPKKQYRLEVRNQEDADKDVSLLGLPAEADWILSAPYTDKALIRNSLIFELGRDIGLTAPRTKHFEIFVNENGGDLNYTTDYRGIYVLAESNEIGNNRIDIQKLRADDSSEPGITGGYLMKWEFGAATGSKLLPGFSSLELVNPDPETEATTAQKNWISNHISEIDARVHGTNFKDPVLGYESVLNLPSYANLIVINELSRDQDAYMRSAYIHKDRNETLTMGPLWDYNLIMGNGCCRNNRDINGWQYIENNGVNEHQWEVRLFQDLDFKQKFIDRWQELRQTHLLDANLHARMDAHAAPLTQAAVRNFAKWDNLNSTNVGFPTPATTTWQGQIDFIKTWTTDRMNWIDGNFTDPPVISPSGGQVSADTNVSISASTGTIYYTTDGTDPRGNDGVISPTATAYSGPITVNATTQILARTRVSSSDWSGMDTETFIIGTPADATNLVISEIHYHPSEPSTAEANAGYTDQDDFEFLEVFNISNSTVDLTEVHFTSGIDFKFPTSTTLAAGQRLIIVRNQSALLFRYLSVNASSIAGEFQNGTGLSNGGETITLNAADGTVIQSLTYGDAPPWQVAPDGTGPSLVLVNPKTYPDLMEPTNWRFSLSFGGTPAGTDGMTFPGGSSEQLLSYITNDVSPTVSQLGNGSIAFTFHITQLSENTEVVLQQSTGLNTWAQAEIIPSSVEPLPSGFANITYNIPAPLASDELFLRLQISEQ